MKETRTLVIGTTALACGLASRLGADCTVVDSGWSAGAEFADAMVAEPIDLARNRAPLSAALVEELWERNALSRTGEVHCPALAGAFAKRFGAAGCRVLLGTRVLGIARQADGFLVTLFLPREGKTELYAERVIDTEPRAFMEYRKTFSLMLTDGIPQVGGEGSPRVRHGRFADESVLTFDVPRDSTLPDAQKIADRWLRENRARLGGAIGSTPSWTLRGTACVTCRRLPIPTRCRLLREGKRYVFEQTYHGRRTAYRDGCNRRL